MEFLTLLLLIILLVFVISLRNRTADRLLHLETEIKNLRRQLEKARTEVQRENFTATSPVAVKASGPDITFNPAAALGNISDPKTESTFPDESIPAAEPSAIPLPETTDPALSEEPFAILQENVNELYQSASSVKTDGPASQKTKPLPPAPKPGFFERHPDLEKFIGENLVSKIGIAVLVLAIGFFVKYAIDNNWIGPVGRVGIGMVCGGILTGLAHYMRKNYKAFSSVLVGGGLAVFYFTITLAYQQFHLFSQTASFIIMVVITAFAVMLSMLYNRQEVAIIALAGGFATPFMVSDGSGNYKTLFVYLIILNTGLLLIAYRKGWRLLNLLAFIFTVVLFASWLGMLPSDEPGVTYRNGFLFASVFYVLFFLINIAHNVKEQKKFIASDFGILLANTCLYFTAGLYCLTKMGAGDFRGLFSISMGVFNLGASYVLFRNRKVDSNILYLLIGITLTFISLTAPIQLQGNHITLFWASEAVLLYWLFQKSRIRIIQVTSLIIWVCMLVSLFMDWTAIYSDSHKQLPVVFNRGFITTLFAAISSYLLFVLRKKEDGERLTEEDSFDVAPGVFRIAALVLLFITGFLEVNHQFTMRFPGTRLNELYLLFYTLAFVLLFAFITQKVSSLKVKPGITAVLLAACVLIYLLVLPQAFSIQHYMIHNQVLMNHFMVHWLSAVLAGLTLYQLILLIRSASLPIKNLSAVTWILCIILLIYFTSEVHLLANAVFYSEADSLATIRRVYIKAGWPILWGLSSFAFMWAGMRHKFKTLRIVSLTVFSVTLLKLFLFDIRNIPAGGKIAAFFSLGILLLVVSFMYQRLKKIIIDNEEKPLV